MNYCVYIFVTFNCINRLYMKIHRAFKFKLKPTKDQREKLAKFSGSCRWLWNYFLDLNQKEYEENKKFVFKYGMVNKLTELKKLADKF